MLSQFLFFELFRNAVMKLHKRNIDYSSYIITDIVFPKDIFLIQMKNEYHFITAEETYVNIFKASDKNNNLTVNYRYTNKLRCITTVWEYGIEVTQKTLPILKVQNW